MVYEPREFVYKKTTGYLKDRQIYYDISESVVHPDFNEKKGVTRGFIRLGGFILV